LQRRWKDGWIGEPDTPRGRRNAHLDMMLFDHGLIRLAWRNMHEVAPGVWRGNQPDPATVRRLAARGFRSILNLRGATEYGSYLLEREACRAAGIALIDLKMTSRELPSAAEVMALDDIFATIERPFLMHCKSGADRAGFASALYLLLRTETPVAEAREQLSWRYLHLQGARTGVLRYMLDAYAAAKVVRPMSFRDWLATEYDPAALGAAYRGGRVADFVADRVLGRE
jgi:protein tyrosine/serine phosphatase